MLTSRLSRDLPQRAALSAVIAVAGLGAACSSTVVRAPVEAESTIEIAPTSELRIETVNGRLELVIDPSRADVHVRLEGRVGAPTREEADRRAAASGIESSLDSDGRLVIRPALATPRHGDDEASLVVTAPRLAGASLRTTNGSVIASSIDGVVEATTTNGRIQLADIGGAVVATTTNGTVELARIAGPTDANTTNGNITVTTVDGAVSVRTTNGSVAIDDVPGPVDATTTNGRVRVALRAGFDGTLDLGATNGSVAVTRAGETLASSRSGATTLVLAPGGAVSRIRAGNGSVTVTIGGEQDPG